MSFNLAVILNETAQSAPDRPVAVYDGGRSELPKNTLGKVLKDELISGGGYGRSARVGRTFGLELRRLLRRGRR